MSESRFDGESFPESKFIIHSFEKSGADDFVAKAELMIRDASLSAELPFFLEIVQNPDGMAQDVVQGSPTMA